MSSPPGEDFARPAFSDSIDCSAKPNAGYTTGAANGSPSPTTGVGGEGRGEVAGETNYLVAVRKHPKAV